MKLTPDQMERMDSMDCRPPAKSPVVLSDRLEKLRAEGRKAHAARGPAQKAPPRRR